SSSIPHATCEGSGWGRGIGSGCFWVRPPVVGEFGGKFVAGHVLDFEPVQVKDVGHRHARQDRTPWPTWYRSSSCRRSGKKGGNTACKQNPISLADATAASIWPRLRGRGRLPHSVRPTPAHRTGDHRGGRELRRHPPHTRHGNRSGHRDLIRSG